MKTAPDKVKSLARGGFVFRVGCSTGGESEAFWGVTGLYPVLFWLRVSLRLLMLVCTRVVPGCERSVNEKNAPTHDG